MRRLLLGVALASLIYPLVCHSQILEKNDTYKNYLEKDTVALKKAVEQAHQEMNFKLMDQMLAKYILIIQDGLTRDQILFIQQFLTSTHSVAFGFFQTNNKKINQIMGSYFGDDNLAIVIHKDFLKKPTTGNVPPPDWTKLAKQVKPFGDIGKYMLANIKWRFYFNQKNWKSFMPAFESFFCKYPERRDNFDMNGRLWDLFEDCYDKKILISASKIQRVIVESEEVKALVPMYTDTYANLLYKADQRDVALRYQKLAIQLTKQLEGHSNYLKDFEDNYDKMLNNKPTWK